MIMKEEKKIINLIWMMLAISLCVFVLAGALVYYVDPFFHYHKPLQNFPYVVDNQLTQNPGMAEHMEYDSIITGSSMTVNFETDWFKELMDLNTIKPSYSSAYPKDISNILSKVFEEKDDGTAREVKNVFIGLDIVTYSGDINETKYPIPKYLYDKNPINDINYLLNKDVLLNYVLRPVVDPEPTNLSHVYASWWTDDYYNEEWVLLNHDAVLSFNPEKLDDHAFDDGINRNLEVNIIPYIETHPETEFDIFFPPYSILFFNDAIMNNHIEATCNAYIAAGEKLNEYNNVKLYFFPEMGDVITNLNNYADYTHYHPSVNRMMTECFVSGEHYVAKDGEPGEGMRDHVDNLRKIIADYDFEELRKKIEEYNK